VVKDSLGRRSIALLVATLLLLSLPAFPSSANVPAHPTRVIVFGDSLSDAGNAYIGSLHDRAPSPPYYYGRFSNGPVWVELFAANFGLAVDAALRGGTDFAVGGAKAGSGADSLPHQADLYLLLSVLSRPDRGALYIVFGGGNDIRSALKLTDPAPALANAALSIRRTIEHLAAWGAVNFLVPNVPDRGLTPAAHERGSAREEEEFTRAYDAGLDAAVRDLPGELRINLVWVDFWSVVERAFAAPRQFGFANTTDPCLVHRQSGYRQCTDPGKYVFWDDIHPTLSGHGFLAAAALAAYSAAVERPSAGAGGLPVAVHSTGAGTIEQEVLRAVRAHLTPPSPARKG
jgi:phospholipase/lecithinase/hemolysin